MKNISIIDSGTGIKISWTETTNNVTEAHTRFFGYNTIEVRVIDNNISITNNKTLIVDSLYTDFVSPTSDTAVGVGQKIANIAIKYPGPPDAQQTSIDDTNKLLSDIRNFNYNYMYNGQIEGQFTNLSLGEAVMLSQKDWAGQIEMIARGTVGTTEKILTDIPTPQLDFFNNPPSVADYLQIVSDSVNDIVSGTGAEYVQVDGLDGTGAEISEQIALDGTNPVFSTTQFLRVNQMQVNSNNVNDGTITCFHPAPAQALAIILPGKAVSKDAMLSVPISKIFLMYQFFVEIISTDVVEYNLYVRPIGSNLRINTHSLFRKESTAYTFDNFPATIPGGLDIFLTAKHNGMAGTYDSTILVRGGSFDLQNYLAKAVPAVDTSATDPIAYPVSGIIFSKNYSS